MKIEDIKKVYFLGIGGIGMSAIAKYFLNLGKMVYGYDKYNTLLTKELESLGAIISYDEEIKDYFENIDIVIYTPAIKENSVIYQWYNINGKKIIKRSEALGIITKDKYTIAVSGSHGKTTVSSMIAFTLRQCGVNCSAFLGGISTNLNSNYIYGEDDIVVVEADEFDRSFLHLNPNIIIVTSIDTDHLDIYGSKEKIVEAFQSFGNLLDKDGFLIVNSKVANIFNLNQETISYGVENADYEATNISLKEESSYFNINEDIQLYKLKFSGLHNIENALATIIVCSLMDIDESETAKALFGFLGVKRRFEYILKTPKVIFIDDYAHHPTEIQSVLNSLKQIYPNKKITSIFQPHLYSRTKDLCIDFAKALDISDNTLLLDIYPARELPIEGVSSMLISQEMKSNVSILSKNEVYKYIQNENTDIVITLGAGDISDMVNDIKMILNEK